jgi:hypothetical protein
MRLVLELYLWAHLKKALSFAARESPLRELPSVAARIERGKGSFDYASASLREALTPLRRTGLWVSNANKEIIRKE